MKFKLKIAKLEDVAEAHRGLYEARDGAFVLKDEFEIADPVDVTGLTSNRDAILKEKTAIEQKFAGIDPEKAREALKKVEGLEAKERTEGDRVASLEKQMADEKSLRLAADQRANLQTIRSEATSAISAAKGRPGADVLLMPFILGDPASGRAPRATVVDGRVQILADDGKTPMLDDKGAPVTMAGLVETFKKQDIFGPVFAATGAGGSAAPGGNSGAADGGQVRTVLSNDQASIDGNLTAIADGSAAVVSQ